MSDAAEPFDFFVSYARADNADGWITQFMEALQAEHRAFTGGREFKCFFDKTDIGSLDACQLRIYDSLADSRLFLAFISPDYFASEWCRREWRTWIDVEIAKHILSDGAAPVYIVEVPWLGQTMSEQQVAKSIAQLTRRVLAPLGGELVEPEVSPSLAADALKVTAEISLRQLTMVQPFYTEGLEALRRADLRKVLSTLARDLDERARHVADAANSRSTIPPYNRRFVGRLDELTLLRERLHQGRTGVIAGHRGDLPEDKSVVASVHGLGGIGKTELAFTYAHAFAGLYPGGRFLVPCDGRADLRQAMLALDEIFRAEISDEQRKILDLHFGAIRDGLRRRLHEMGRILLVLDNVTDAALLNPEQTDTVRTLGPELHLLATTRLGAPQGGGTFDDVHWLTLGELSFEDSLRLLEKHRPFATPEERMAAESIARRLGGFALCVEVVGAYLGQHPDQSYAQFLQTMGLEDLAPVDLAAERRNVVTRRHNNEKRLRIILDHTLRDLSPAAMCALHFAALLPPDHIVLPWLSKLVGDVHPALATDAAAWPRLIARLVSLALLTRGDGEAQALDESRQPRILRCHRLVQDYLRGKFEDEERAACQEAVDQLVRERDTLLQETTRWEEARWELDPLTALAGFWADSNHPDAAWLLNQTGLRWHHLADWSRAEPLLRRALAIIQACFGPDHPRVAIHLNNLAQLLEATNRLEAAEPLMRRALTMDESSLGPAHPEVARDLSNLAHLLQATDRLEEAEPLLRRALAINQTSLGEHHPTVARNLNNLALLLNATNRLEEAEPLLRRALAMDETSLGEHHPNVAIALNNLAQLLQDTNRLEEAEPLLRRALAIDVASLGAEHPRVAIDLNNLALLLQVTNRLAEAELVVRRVLAIFETSLGDKHPNVAIALINLAGLLHATNRLAEAEPLMRRALVIDETSFGPEHPNVAGRLNNLAQLLKATNRLAEAESLMRRVLAIFATSLGEHHPNVAVALNNLAELLQSTNRLAEAEPLLRRALEIGETSLGSAHPTVAATLNNLARLLQDNKRPAEAEPLLRRALEIDESSFGPEHPKVALRLNNIAGLLQDTNRPAEAEPLMRRALVIDETSFGSEHPEVATDLNNLARLLQATNRPAEAEPILRRALEIFVKFTRATGHPHLHLQTVRNNYAGLLGAMGRSREEIRATLHEMAPEFF
jgi:tetratricopeptide (TPR) repeat protein